MQGSGLTHATRLPVAHMSEWYEYSGGLWTLGSQIDDFLKKPFLLIDFCDHFSHAAI